MNELQSNVLKRHKSNEEPSVSEPGELLFIMGENQKWEVGGAVGRWGGY